MGNNFSREAETERAYQRLKQAYDDQVSFVVEMVVFYDIKLVS